MVETSESEAAPIDLAEGGSDGDLAKQGGLGCNDEDAESDISEESDTPSVYRDGFLWKQGGKWKSWKRRWFVVEDSTLIYYRQQGDGEPVQSSVDLKDCTVHLPEEKKLVDTFCFVVHTCAEANKRADYVIRAETEDERDEWMQVFRSAGQFDRQREKEIEEIKKEAENSGMSIKGGLRALVSKQKRRYQQDGFDLDLTYITDEIIAMGFPSEGTEGVYRNPMDEVIRFMDTYHHNQYKIYNLCSERTYVARKFHNRVAMFPFDDHNTPPLVMLVDFCENAERWLKRRKKNIVVIHCKAGKGRTGLMICCLLIHMNICNNAQESLRLYGNKRTLNSKGVTIASQIRYVEYFEKIHRDGFPQPRRLVLKSIRMWTTPNMQATGGCTPSYTVWENFAEIVSTRKKKVQRYKDQEFIDFPVVVSIRGDIKIEFFDQDSFGTVSMCYLCFHTSYLETPSHKFQKYQIDGANKDKRKRFTDKFAIELTLQATD